MNWTVRIVTAAIGLTGCVTEMELKEATDKINAKIAGLETTINSIKGDQINTKALSLCVRGHKM
jgi:hypothetical protein